MNKNQVFHLNPAYKEKGDTQLLIDVLFAGEKVSSVQEELWTKKISENKYYICCIPFLLTNISLGDVVEIETIDSETRIAQILESSNLVTYRVWKMPSSTFKFSNDIFQILKNMKCEFEINNDYNVMGICIDISDTNSLEDYLVDLCEKNDLQFNKTSPQKEADYKIHYDPVWRNQADTIVHAKVETNFDEEIYESLWAQKIESNLYKICCIPFFIYNLGLGDIVDTVLDNRGGLILNKVIERSGNETFWIYLKDLKKHELVSIFDKINAHNCPIEGYNKNFLTFSAKSESQSNKILNSLSTEIKRGIIQCVSNRTA